MWGRLCRRSQQHVRWQDALKAAADREKDAAAQAAERKCALLDGTCQICIHMTRSRGEVSYIWTRPGARHLHGLPSTTLAKMQTGKKMLCDRHWPAQLLR